MTVWVDPLDGTAEYTQVKPTYLHCCGSGMFIPDRNFPCRIQDSGSRPKNTSKWRNFEKKNSVWEKSLEPVPYTDTLKPGPKHWRKHPLNATCGVVDPWHIGTDPIRIRGSWFFRQWLTRCQQKKSVFPQVFFAFYFLKVPYIFISFHR